MYSGNRVDTVTSFERLVHAHVSCVVIFDTEQPTWSAWENPWFTNNKIPVENWNAFARVPRNRLIITVNLFPDAAQSTNWRVLGAAGAYAGYARKLASNLVAHGMGHATIRLGHEANGPWSPDNAGTTPAQWALWREFWRKTVFAMKSVAGAHFRFDWCIANGTRAIPFAAYYPGDDVVDSIGVDVYDMGVPAGLSGGTARWLYQYNRPGGLAALVRFARQHKKPLAIPEWGLEPTALGGSGDNVAFTTGIQRLLKEEHVEFQAYFFAGGSRTALEQGAQSLRVYRGMIGSE